MNPSNITLLLSSAFLFQFTSCSERRLTPDDLEFENEDGTSSLNSSLNSERPSKFSWKSSDVTSRASNYARLSRSISNWGEAASSSELTPFSNSEAAPRSASDSDHRPNFMKYILDFNGVQPIRWPAFEKDWQTVDLTSDQRTMIEQYAQSDQGEQADFYFISKVYKTLKFLGNSYPINDFIVNLAVYMVNKYDVKGPNAAKLFLDSRFGFMAIKKKKRWSRNKTIELEWDHSRLLIELEPHLEDLEEWHTLRRDFFFDYHVRSLFLDMLQGTQEFDSIMMIYMQVFKGVTDSAHFVERYAQFMKILIRLAGQYEGPITVDHVAQVLMSDTNDLMREIDATVF